VNLSPEPHEFGSAALRKTFHVLATTQNLCAENTLVAALQARSAEVVTAAARAILVRKSNSGFEAIIRQWDSLRSLLVPILGLFPSRLVSSLSKCLDPAQPVLARTAMGIAVDIAEYDLIPMLLPYAEDVRSPLHKVAEETLVALTESLFEETHGRRSYARKRDPQLARARVVGELENSIGRFDRHRNVAILTSFLALAGRENAQVVRLLSSVDGSTAVHQETVKLLKTSQVRSVLRLLASFLDHENPPLAAIKIASERTDSSFIEECLKRVEQGNRERLAANLKRSTQWDWLTTDTTALETLYEDEQSAAVTFAMLCGIPSDNRFAILRWVLAQGRVGARVRAAEAILEFKGEEANGVVLAHLNDPEPRVRATLLGQLREREIPGAISRLIAALDDPDPLVRSSMQKQLPEFRFRRFADLYDSMDPLVQQANGRIVKRVDPLWRGQLEAELKTDMRLRKLRGLRMANTLEAGDELVEAILPFTSDSEAMARHEAIGVLRQSNSPKAIEAIRQCMMDESVIVRRAAEDAMRAKSLLHQANSSMSPQSVLDSRTIPQV
jgi:HEAT repeat protein